MTDEEINEMPWKREDQDLTLEEYEWWVASRKEAGLKIDIETCELGYWYTCYDDAYGLREAKGDLPEAIKQEAQLHGVNRFVRSPESRGWVCEDDDCFAGIVREWSFTRIEKSGGTFATTKLPIAFANEDALSLLLRHEQRVDESIHDNRDRDYDIDAQQDQQGQGPPAQVTARERPHCRGCELIWFKRADQRGIVLHGISPTCPTGSGRL